MPSIPQSLLWISLVVLWLFVLVPMLISKRDAVRRTSDVALATRVLNGTASGRLLKRAGPASGHRSDPDWRPSEDDLDETFDDDDYEDDYEAEEADEEDEPEKTVVLAAPAVEVTEPDYLDVDVIEEPAGALPVGESAVDELTLFEEPEEAEDVDGGRRGRRGRGARRGRSGRGERRHRDLRSRVRRIRRRRTTAPPTSTSTSTTHRASRLRRKSDLQIADSIVARPATPLRPGEGRGDQRPQVQVPQADAGVHDAGDAGFGRRPPTSWRRRRAVGLVRLRRDGRGDADVPGLPAQSDAHRGTAAAAPRQADAHVRASAWRTPRTAIRPGPVAAAQARIGRVGDRRRGPDLRASRLRAREPALRPAKGAGSNRGFCGSARRLVACATDQGLWRSW